MNERFKELAEQATVTRGRMRVIDEEKFAELIVQECAQLLFAEAERLYSYSSECDNMHDSDEAEVCAEKCIDNIKMIEQHFGVEE